MTLIVNDIKRVSSLFLFFERVLQGYDVIAEGKKKEKKRTRDVCERTPPKGGRVQGYEEHWRAVAP